MTTRLRPSDMPMGKVFANTADHQLLVGGSRHDRYLGDKAGGMDKLKGKKIVHLYHDSAFGKEPFPVLEAYGEAARNGAGRSIAVPHPGNGCRTRSGCRSVRPIRTT